MDEELDNEEYIDIYSENFKYNNNDEQIKELYEKNQIVESNDVIVHWVNAIYQTTTDITISPDPGLVGETVAISVNVKDNTNNADVPAGDIVVYFEEVQKGTISNNGNINSDTLSTAKEYTVNARYQGLIYNHNYYNVSEDTYKFTPIESQPTTISIDASANEILVDGSSVITVEVKSANDIVSLGDVEIYINGTRYGSYNIEITRKNRYIIFGHGRAYTGTTFQWFNGMIDELRVVDHDAIFTRRFTHIIPNKPYEYEVPTSESDSETDGE